MDLSVIIPCFNEEESLPAFLEAAVATLGPSDLEYELVFIDDGSSDGTPKVLDEFARSGRAPHVCLIQFSRNFGKEAGILAGLEYSKGDVCGIIDADMQQTPETLMEMYRCLIEHPEYDCVAACQGGRKQGAVRRFLSESFYGAFSSVTSTTLTANASDFRVFRRPVTDALVSMPEYHRFSKGLFAWVGFNVHPFPYTPSKRAAGSSKWNLRSLAAYGVGGMMNFSTLPLRIVTWVGSLSCIAALIYLIRVIYEWATLHNSFSGYPTIVCLILLFGGFILLSIGIIGEYVARIYIEGKHRPVFIARQPKSFDNGMESDRDVQTNTVGHPSR